MRKRTKRKVYYLPNANLINYVTEKVSFLEKAQQETIVGELRHHVNEISSGSYYKENLDSLCIALYISVAVEDQAVINGFDFELERIENIVDKIRDNSPVTDDEVQDLQTFINIFTFQLAKLTVGEYHAVFEKARKNLGLFIPGA